MIGMSFLVWALVIAAVAAKRDRARLARLRSEENAMRLELGLKAR
jgi:hypothetical protein